MNLPNVTNPAAVETKPTLTRREVFRKVAVHLLTQNAKAINSRTTACMYRGDKGNKCAVGALIDDEHYSYDCEGNNVLGVDDQFSRRGRALRAALTKSGVPLDSRTVTMLYQLQLTHDQTPPERWLQRIAEIERETDFGGAS